MCYGLEIRSAVSVFNKESLVVLEPIGRARDGVLEQIGVVVFNHLARTLLKVGCSYDAEIRVGGQTYFFGLSRRRLYDDGKNRVLLAVLKAGQNNFALVTLAVFRNDATNGLVAPVVTARGLENRADVFPCISYAEIIGHHSAQPPTVTGGVSLGCE